MTATGSSPAAAGETPWSARAAGVRRAALQIEYCTPAELEGRSASSWRDVLGVVLYGELNSESPALECSPGERLARFAAPAELPVVTVASEQLGPAPARVELWRLHGAPGSGASAGGALRSGQQGAIRYRHGEGLLFAALSVPERTGAGPSLQLTTQSAYSELFATLQRLGFEHPVRIWNYLPDLNRPCDGVQRYAQFNAGRQDAFLQARRPLAADVPAASVLGVHRNAPVTIYCLAGREAPLPLENPRQCSAWDYPPQYSERRPTFARACVDRSGALRLFISGTASILGHRSEHPGDTVAQTREILRNIRALLATANERVGAARFSEQALAYKVYVRDRQDHSAIERVLAEELGEGPVRLFLRADVCRPELLVEIEATSV